MTAARNTTRREVGCVYLDNNATTPMLPAVWEAMRPYLTEAYGNPSSAHQVGRKARRALEDAREKVAELLDATDADVIFTSGATEANNLALMGLVGSSPSHIIASPIEHPCVIEPLRKLEERGFTIDWLPVDETGTVPVDSFGEKLRPETRLVSVMLANHETGAVQPVRVLANVLAEKRIPAALHCDAVQAVGKMPVSFRELGVTSMSLSAHKFHGPKGIGALLVRAGLKLRPLLWGGHQQMGRRPGTEPVALAVGLATALDLVLRERKAHWEHVLKLRETFQRIVESGTPPVVLNGPARGGLPHTLNLSFPGTRADSLLMSLDLAGVACATGSACSSGSLLPSPVLKAMNVSPEVLNSAMRFSFSPFQTIDEVEEAARRVVDVVHRLRATGGLD